jgi:hypothetical protein
MCTRTFTPRRVAVTMTSAKLLKELVPPHDILTPQGTRRANGADPTAVAALR